MAADILQPDDAAIARAAAALSKGELVAIPTETVYGLAARADDADALARIYQVKRRPSDKPLIVHVRDVTQAREFAGVWPPLAARLAARFWPGPLTLVLPRSSVVLDAVSAGLPTVALRAPKHEVTQRLLAACPFPLAASSANRSGQEAPTSALQVQSALTDWAGLIVDGGPCSVGEPSTIVSIGDDGATVLRRGGLAAEIEQLLTG